MSPLTYKIVWGVVAALGVALCFWGYRMMRYSLSLMGALAGALIGLVIARQLQLGTGGTLLLTLVASLVCSGLSGWFYVVGVFCVGGFCASLLATLLSAKVGWGLPAGVVIVAFVAGGLAGVFFEHRLMVAMTAVAGALLVLLATGPFLSGASPPTRFDLPWLRLYLAALSPLALVAGGVLAVGGYWAQSRDFERYGRRSYRR